MEPVEYENSQVGLLGGSHVEMVLLHTSVCWIPFYIFNTWVFF